MTVTQDEFSPAFSTAFDPAGAPAGGSCVPFTPDLGCIGDEEWEAFGPEVQARAVDLAWASMKFLSGGRLGYCAVTARPCKAGCRDAGWATPYGAAFVPVQSGGEWFNLACGCGASGDCGCSVVCEVAFPGAVAMVTEVLLGGATLDPTAYRLLDANRLVRTDGDCWPVCQDLAAAPTEAGTFAVSYVPGIVPGPAGLWAVGLLAVEFARACTGGKCRLPSSVTSLSRQGVSFEFSQGMFAGGMTGIREVDAYVMSINPTHLKQPPRVWSPDLRTPAYERP